MQKSLPFIIIVVILIIAVAGGLFLWKRSGATSVTPDSTFATSSSNALPTATSTQTQSQPSDARATTKPNGKVNSAVVLEEYGDYQCPPCGQLYPELKQLEKEYGNQLQIVFHHFPLTKIHKNALMAARTAEAARNQNKFWEMHDRLYRNQKEWSELDDPRPVFTGYARELGLNVEKFNGDLGSNLIDQRIGADMQRGTSQGVTGTPTVFLDSRMVNYQATNLEGLRQGINLLLEQKPRS